jgi:hypothetical protein
MKINPMLFPVSFAFLSHICPKYVFRGNSKKVKLIRPRIKYHLEEEPHEPV